MSHTHSSSRESANAILIRVGSPRTLNVSAREVIASTDFIALRTLFTFLSSMKSISHSEAGLRVFLSSIEFHYARLHEHTFIYRCIISPRKRQVLTIARRFNWGSPKFRGGVRKHAEGRAQEQPDQSKGEDYVRPARLGEPHGPGREEDRDVRGDVVA